MRFVLQSGRRVSVAVTSTRGLGGDTDGRLIVFCHSAPGAGVFDPDPDETGARGVTLLSVDRPGYGRSDPVPRGCWATVGSAADDIAAVLEGLHAERVGVVGWSAGGRVALALAARHPELVERVVVIATPAPHNEVPWVDDGQHAVLETLRGAPSDVAHAELDRRLGSLDPDDPFYGAAVWLLAAAMSDGTVDGDGTVRERLGETARAAFAHGTGGLAADIAGWSLRPWGFEPGDVGAKTLLLYGSKDPVAGPRHGRWWQTRLPEARLEVVPGEGHLLVVPAWPRVLSHLAPHSKVRVLPVARGARGDEGIEEFTAA